MAGTPGSGACLILFTICLKFDVKVAVAHNLSSLAVSALTRTLTKLKARNDDGTMLLNYSLVSYILPLLVIGAYTGVYLNFVLPNMIIIICFCLLGLILQIINFKSFLTKYRAE